MADEYTRNELERMTVPMIKEILASRLLIVSGRKADLITRLLTPNIAEIKASFPRTSVLRQLIVIRHAKQISHRVADSVIIEGQGPPIIPHFDTIVCSPYLRTRQTALLINPDKIKPMMVDNRLAEGQGHKGKSGIPYLHPSTNSHFHHPETAPDYSETVEMFESRIRAAYIGLLERRCANVLVITHGVVVNQLEKIIRGATTWSRGRTVPFMGGFVARM